MIGIIGAMDVEVARLIEMLEDCSTEVISGCTFSRGKLCGKDVVIAKSGVGKVNAAVCAQTMILKYSPDIVFNTGVAGSLSSKLDICDVAVGVDVVQHDVDTSALGDEIGFVSTVNKLYFELDAAVSKAVIEAANNLNVHAVPARIASGDQFVSDGAVKARIVKLFNADACEMEGGAVAQVCHINNVCCAVIRSISDSTTGDHAMEYTSFVKIAAENSVNVLLETLKSDLI